MCRKAIQLAGYCHLPRFVREGLSRDISACGSVLDAYALACTNPTGKGENCYER
jgi:hypothetical protein